MGWEDYHLHESEIVNSATSKMDGRTSNSELARELRVSEGTVRRRLWRLVQEDVIRITAVPNIE